jgi:hypothetical protein
MKLFSVSYIIKSAFSSEMAQSLQECRLRRTEISNEYR